MLFVFLVENRGVGGVIGRREDWDFIYAQYTEM